MHLAKRTERGWIVHCDCQGAAQFAVPPLGIAIECTRCGRTALAVDLVADYWLRSTEIARRGTGTTATSARDRLGDNSRAVGIQLDLNTTG